MKLILSVFFLCLFSFCHAQYDTTGPIDERIIRSVIEIANIEGSGSGFLVENGDKRYLVTNKHMIASWTPVDQIIFFDTIYLNLYPNNISDAALKIPIHISSNGNLISSKVKLHPNPKIDVAIVDITQDIANAQIYNTFFLDWHFLQPLDSVRKVLSYGSHIFTVGFPAGNKSYKTNLPLAKSGYIASTLKGDLVMEQTWLNRQKHVVKALTEGKIFIVDGLIIPGNSGGPVLIPKETVWRRINGQEMHYSPEQNAIIGIVSNIFDGTGLTTVFSSDNILEVFQQFR